MRDQASTLRTLLQRRVTEPVVSEERARLVTITSGKGGVGKSLLTLNLAVAMAHRGARVCVLDANPGLSNIDVLCGLNAYWHFGHVLTGAKSLADVLLKGPAGLNVLCGASGLAELARTRCSSDRPLAEQIAHLEAAYDVLIVDAGCGLTETARRFADAADLTLLVTTAEPTAIADAYSVFKAWQGNVTTRPELLINRVTFPGQGQQILERFAQTVETFLRCSAPIGHCVAEDPSVATAVSSRQPFVIQAPNGAAARDVSALAKKLVSGSKPVRQELLVDRLCRLGNL